MISFYILSFPEPIIELVDNESLKPCVVLSSLFAVKRLLWKPCGLVWWLA